MSFCPLKRFTLLTFENRALFCLAEVAFFCSSVLPFLLFVYLFPSLWGIHFPSSKLDFQLSHEVYRTKAMRSSHTLSNLPLLSTHRERPKCAPTIYFFSVLQSCLPFFLCLPFPSFLLCVVPMLRANLSRHFPTTCSPSPPTGIQCELMPDCTHVAFPLAAMLTGWRSGSGLGLIHILASSFALKRSFFLTLASPRQDLDYSPLSAGALLSSLQPLRILLALVGTFR